MPLSDGRGTDLKALSRFACAAALTASAAVLAKKREDLRKEEEEKKFLPPGEMVDVDGKRMHILITAPEKPDGEECMTAPSSAAPSPVIVMLPGYGTPGPSLDFLPLARKLSEKGFLCVSPDPFGYGFSDDTLKPRTSVVIIEEIRTALCKLQIPTPYILLGHSMAGFYIRIWADKYPEEICGLICEDISLPELMENMQGEKALIKIQQAQNLIMQKTAQFGLDRIIINNSPGFRKSAHNDPEILAMLRFVARKSRYSKALQDENIHFEQAAEQTSKCSLPSCPCLVFIATGKGSASQMKFKNGFSWLQAHLDLADALSDGRAVELPGMHYLHWDFADEMAEEISDMFISD